MMEEGVMEDDEGRKGKKREERGEMVILREGVRVR